MGSSFGGPGQGRLPAAPDRPTASAGTAAPAGPAAAFGGSAETPATTARRRRHRGCDRRRAGDPGRHADPAAVRADRAGVSRITRARREDRRRAHVLPPRTAPAAHGVGLERPPQRLRGPVGLARREHRDRPGRRGAPGQVTRGGPPTQSPRDGELADDRQTGRARTSRLHSPRDGDRRRRDPRAGGCSRRRQARGRRCHHRCRRSARDARRAARAGRAQPFAGRARVVLGRPGRRTPR